MQRLSQLIMGVVMAGGVGLASPAGTPSLRTADHTSSTRDIVENMRPLPADAQCSLEVLYTAMMSGERRPSPRSGQALVNFVRRVCAEDSGWKLDPREGAEGAAYVVRIESSFPRFLALNLDPDIPDYAIFPSSLRYSSCLDTQALSAVYACISRGPTGEGTCVSGRLTGTEEITPNPESGSYYSYTNTRAYARYSRDGCDVLLSCSELTGPSSFSSRGVPVGPADNALFYYSGKPGLNLPGMTWIKSQITRSSTLSLYCSLGSNETVAASFAWLNAGWKGMNVIRARHILNSQINTLDFTRRIAEHPAAAPERLAEILAAVNGMSAPEMDARYRRYLDYVQSWRDGSDRNYAGVGKLLRALYDPTAAATLPPAYRRALIAQEEIRALLGQATWSGVLPVPIRQ